MSVTIGGVRVPTINLEIDKEDSRVKMRGSYELMSNTGVVLAKQGFNGYQEISVGQSPTTVKLTQDLLAAVRADINVTLGLES